MATLTKTKQTTALKKKAAVKPEEYDSENEETETKAEADVIVSKPLAVLCKEWKNSYDKTESYFPRICQMVQENEISRAELKKALIEIRGMKELTANNEVSAIMNIVDRVPEMIEQAIDGDITTRDLREAGRKKQEGKEEDLEGKLDKSLVRLAKFAIAELELESGELVAKVKDAYKKAYASIEAKAAKDEEGEGEEAEEGEDEDTE